MAYNKINQDINIASPKHWLNTVSNQDLISTPAGECCSSKGEAFTIKGDALSSKGDSPSIKGDTFSPNGDSSSIKGDAFSPKGDSPSIKGDTFSPKGDTSKIAKFHQKSNIFITKYYIKLI